MLATTVEDPLDELVREDEVVGGLLQRLDDVASTLRKGSNVPEGAVDEGLRLLEDYWKIHVRRFDQDFEPKARPYARPVPMARCTDHLDRIESDHALLRAQIAMLRQTIRSQSNTPETVRGRRATIAGELANLTLRIRETLNYESDYPLACLLTALPEEVSARIEENFAETENELGEVEARIRQYAPVRGDATNSDTVTLTCAHPDCSATARVTAHVADGDTPSVLLPPGWRVAPLPNGEPRYGSASTSLVACCPKHVAEWDRTKATERAVDAWADDGGPPGSQTDPAVESDCSECPHT
jgi:hypothetical protein